MARILILEDDPDQSTLMGDALQADGHECVFAATVEEAMRVLNSRPIDLALVDMNLPGRPGLEAVSYIRNTPSLLHIPVIVVTANPQFHRQADQVGTDLFLVKPLNLKELRVLVQRLSG